MSRDRNFNDPNRIDVLEPVAGGGGSSPLSALGDIFTHDGTSDDRLPAGTDGYVLQADSGETLGMKWVQLSHTVPLFAEQATTIIAGAHGASEEFFNDDVPRFVMKLDLTEFTQARFTGVKRAQIANTGARLDMRFAAAYSLSAFSYAPMGTSSSDIGFAIDVVAATFLDSGWVTLDASAQADVFIAPILTGGDGAANPRFATMSYHFR